MRRRLFLVPAIVVGIVVGAVALTAIFVVASSSDDPITGVSQDEALEIARDRVDFKWNLQEVRFVDQTPRRGAAWEVTFYDVGPDGTFRREQAYVVDAVTGAVSAR